MLDVVHKLSVNYGNYKMTEIIYSDNTFVQTMIDTKACKVIRPVVMDGEYKSTSRQLRRYLKYLVTNTNMIDNLSNKNDCDTEVVGLTEEC